LSPNPQLFSDLACLAFHSLSTFSYLVPARRLGAGGSTVALIVTLVLFAMALFTKGFTHDLLLEAGVFLVSIKLALAGYKHEYTSRDLINRLDQIQAQLDRLECRETRK
jgi:hypothetical protein